MRGIAPLIVIATHFWNYQLHMFWGWSVMEFFFVLSGYLITTILLLGRDRPGFVKNFFVRRTLRVWPVYFIALLFTIGGCDWLGCGFEPSAAQPSGLPFYFFFAQFVDYYAHPLAGSHAYIPIFMHSWSVAMEEQFYLLWPLTFLLLRPALRSVLIGGAVIMAVAFWMRWHGHIPFLLFSRSDGLVLGVVLAYARMLLADASPAARRRWHLLLTTCLLGASVLIVPYMLAGLRTQEEYINSDRSVALLVFAVFYFGAIGLVAEHTGHRLLAPLRAPLLVLLGNMSYSLYLLHLPVVFFVARPLGARWPILHTQPALFIGVACVFALSYASWKLMEQPIIRLKKRSFSYGTRGE